MSKFSITEEQARNIELRFKKQLSREYSVDPIYVEVRANRYVNNNIIRVRCKVFEWANVLHIYFKEDMFK